MFSTVRCAAVATILILLLGCAVAHEASNPPLDMEGTWHISVLLSGRRPIPASHKMRVHGGEIDISEMNYDIVSNFFANVGERLNLVELRVPSSSDLCRLPENVHVNSILGRVANDAVQLGCNEELIAGLSLRQLITDKVAHRELRDPAPLYTLQDGHCEPLPWSVLRYSILVLDKNRIVASLHLRENASGAPCRSLFELSRITESNREGSTAGSSGTIYGPLVMLLLVIALRTLPRYYLRRTGSIDSGSYRLGENASHLRRRRAELLRQQDAIIRQMKAEDGVLDGDGSAKKND